ncbi:PQQ-binding-like beta-propeller repeat protein [Actinoallomurus sp. NPDC052308]|uniref:serine/threonine-protein kinase n=1 Tax=Actinoallomurus sp. NPDC052308 TaxID=3155530 RepID=UPI00342EABBF
MVRVPAADDPRRIGPYAVLAELGAGGMGRVHLCRSEGGRLVAVKVVREEFADDPGFRRRFRREVEAARAVNGFFTAPVVDADADGPLPWLATAYIPGPSLGDAVRDHGPLPEPAVRALGAGLAEALLAVHGAGLVHRDLKPANVLLAADGPRVIDFGISKALDGTQLTRTGGLVGTPAYMSPEQVTSDGPIGPASDVFSLAGVLVFAAAGAGPFGAGGAQEVLYRVVYGEPDLTGVPGGLRGVLAECLARDPAARPTPEAVLTALAPADPAALALSALRADQDRRVAEAAALSATAPPVAPSDATATTARTLTGPPSPDRRRFLSLAAGVAGGLVVAGGATTALAWPTGGHKSRRRPAPRRTFAAAPAPVWTLPRPGGAFDRQTLTLLVAGGLLVWGDQAVLHGVDPAAGRLRWTRKVTALTGGGRGRWTNVAGSTAYAIVDPGSLAEETILVELDVVTGRRILRRDLPDADADVNGSAVSGAGGIVVVPTGARPGRSEYGAVAAVDSGTGRVLWRQGADSPGDRLNMAADQARCYIADAGRLSALDLATGMRRWRINVAAYGSDEAALALTGDRLYVAANGLLAIDPSTGTRAWTALPGVFATDAVVTGATVVAAVGDTVAGVDRGTGGLRWQTPSPAPLWAGSANSHLRISASTEVAAAPFDAAVGVTGGDKVTAPSGFLVVATADGDPRWAYQAAPGVQWHVAVIGGRVYATDGTALYAYEGGGR